jgi:hypothetical protein
LPLTAEPWDMRTIKYCECLSDLDLEEFWVFGDYIKELSAHGLPPLKDFASEQELLRRIDYCKTVYWSTDVFDPNSGKKRGYFGALYEAIKNRHNLKK